MDKEVAFITGATSGIGAAFACYYAKKGYDLILTGHPNDKVASCIEEIKGNQSVNVDIVFAELSNDDDIAKLEEIIRRNPAISVLINNAGFVFGKPFWLNEINDLEDMVKVHIIAPVRFIYAALPYMTKENKGIIIHLSSLASFMPIPQDSMYSATKLFNNSFMESLHISLKNKGIKVQVLCPGFVRTNFHTRAGVRHSEFKNRGIIRWMQPEKVVEISIRNLSKKNKVIVIPGFWNKLIKFIISNMPRSTYYRVASKFLQ